MSDRPPIPDETQRQIFEKSARVCALCYMFERDASVKVQGQIAHVDRNSKNHALENLAWLCLAHHDLYDSTPSQSKKLQPSELTTWRSKVYDLVAGDKAPTPYTGPRAVLEMEVDLAELWPIIESHNLRAKNPEPIQHLYLFLVKVCNVGFAWTGIRDASLKVDGVAVGRPIPTLESQSVQTAVGARGFRVIQNRPLLFPGFFDPWRRAAKGLEFLPDQGVGAGQQAVWTVGFVGEPRLHIGQPGRYAPHQVDLASPWLLELVPVAGAPVAVEIAQLQLEP